MKKLYLIILTFIVVVSASACSKEKETEPQVTNEPSVTEELVETPTEAPTAAATEEPTASPSNESVSNTESPTEATESTPQVVQKEGWISITDAESLLRTFLGSYDSNGNEFIFGCESTINKDGKDYYNFRVTTLIFDGSGTVHQSYYGNYIVSTDGFDIEEY